MNARANPVYVLLLALPLTLSAREKKPSGDVADRVAFAKIQTFCVDMHDLASDEAYQVRGFLDEESKPKRLLTKIPWKLIPDCGWGELDAVVKVEFAFHSRFRVGPGPPPGYPEDMYNLRVVLRVSESGASRLLYQVETAPLSSGSSDSTSRTEAPLPVLRRDALYNAFWTMIQDWQRVTGASKK